MGREALRILQTIPGSSGRGWHAEGMGVGLAVNRRGLGKEQGRSVGKGDGVQAAKAVIRQHVDHLDVDRPLFPDHNAMAALVESGEILDAVEAEVGPLG